MNTSSAQDLYSITLNDTLNDTITIDTSSWSNYTTTITSGASIDTISISNGNGYSSGTISAVTINSGTIGGSTDSWNWKMPEEFIDAFPDYDRIQKMCKEYPGLKIAYEKFVTTYKLVKDDYDTPKDKRPKP
jgi:hypothetical protein